MAINDEIPPAFPGLDTGIPSLAPGSPGVSADETAGPLLASPVISVPGASSQLAESKPVLSVYAGDTSSFSDDEAAHASPIMPGPVADYTSDGPQPTRADHWTRYSWQQSPGGD